MLTEFTLIAGPCVLEDDDVNLTVARTLAGWGAEHGLPVVFKASFDKANRSSPDSPRGPGLALGLDALRRVKDETGLALTTDVHEPPQAAVVAEVVDVIQIPAFLCRQTDLLVAAGETGKTVNIKKGQWTAPEELAGAVEKARRAGAEHVVVTERGTAFGYGDLVVDMRSFGRVRRAAGVPVFFDGTHAVQRPGRAAGSTGGDVEHVPALVRAAVAAGCDGLFLETHPDPRSAPSDRATMLALGAAGTLVAEVCALRHALARPATTPT